MHLQSELENELTEKNKEIDARGNGYTIPYILFSSVNKINKQGYACKMYEVRFFCNAEKSPPGLQLMTCLRFSDPNFV